MIFLDNASTTRMDAELIKIIENYSINEFFNPSAPYYKAKDIGRRLGEAQKDILRVFNGVKGSTFVFTSSATESNNSVLLGQLNKRYNKVIISRGEHNSISSTVAEIERKGFEVVYVDLNNKGQVDINDFKTKMTEDVGLVSIIHVSNETGAINDIETLVKIAKEVNPNCLFHADGVQAFGKIDIDLTKLDVDYYTISAHKIHGPKGIAGLYVKKTFKPYILGGGQQNGLRSGTENVPNIFAFAEICKKQNSKEHFAYVKELRDEFISIIKRDDGIIVNDFDCSSPYILSLIFKGVNGETMVNALEKFDIFVGVGSACSSKKIGNSTLEAMGFSKDVVRGSVRVSFDFTNTKEEVITAGKTILETYQKYNKQVNGRE